MNTSKLFDFIKVMFNQKLGYSNVSNADKKRHAFMINRFWSIKHPETAGALNILKINSVEVVNLWSRLALNYKKIPYWFYTKTKKKKAKSLNFKYSEEAINKYMNIYEVDSCSLASLQKMYPNELKKELTAIEKQLNVISPNK